MAACSEKSTNIEVNADILHVTDTTYTTVYTQL